MCAATTLIVQHGIVNVGGAIQKRPLSWHVIVVDEWQKYVAAVPMRRAHIVPWRILDAIVTRRHFSKNFSDGEKEKDVWRREVMGAQIESYSRQ